MTSDAPLAECADCLCLASRRAARALTRAFDRQLRPHNIRATQFSILTALLLGGPQTIGALADFLGVERTTLTRNLVSRLKHYLSAIAPQIGNESRLSPAAAGR